MDKVLPEVMGGCLYIVALPIGNADDITLRALQVLAKVDLIAAEDTRSAGRFLAVHNIKNHLIAYHEHNEDEKAVAIVKQMSAGKSIALISDAGTPTISDPGFRLIQTALALDLKVIPIPGVSAAVTALSASGLPTDSFLFLGFLAKKKIKRMGQIEAQKDRKETLIIYESPKRILALIDEMISHLGDRYAILARELTKKHEEFIRDRLSGIKNKLKQKKAIKGECTLLIAGHSGDVPPVSSDRLSCEIRQGLDNDVKPSELSKNLATRYNLKKKDVYAEILKIVRRSNNPSKEPLP